MHTRNDIRPTLIATTIEETGEYRIVMVNRFGERKEIHHLSFLEAYDRKKALTARGYNVSMALMTYAEREAA